MSIYKSNKRPVNIHDDITVFALFTDNPTDFLLNFAVGHLQRIRYDGVENQVRMAHAGHHAEIVNCDIRIDGLHGVGNEKTLLRRHVVVRLDRIHMDHGDAAELTRKRLFRVVDDIVQHKNILIAADFGVQRHHDAAGAVIMHDEIMNADDLLIRHDELFNLIHELFFRRASEQRTDGFLDRFETRVDDKRGNKQTAPAVNRQIGELGGNRRNQNDKRRYGVADAVRRRRLHSGGIDLGSDPAVIEEHIAFD